ncbi:MAG: prepilin-type N-terminal cleavage/methylation domain-containing protein [Clostridiales bacterium]|nr:prepilin-type N-terminal cleavage/methylation domain-containing protein [Clostridiales bacterium]
MAVLKERLKQNEGFTLVEILVALAILGILIPPVIGLFTAASASNLRSVRNTVALTVARDIMDRIKAGEINTSNQYQEIEYYREKHQVEIFVPGIPSGAGNALDLLRVYVTPRQGMDPQTEGIMLASYATNVFIDEIDTTQLYDPGPGGGGYDDGVPGPGDDNDPDKLWSDYYEYVLGLETIGSNLMPTVSVLPLILLDKLDGIETLRQAMEASYLILHKAKKPYPPKGYFLSWRYLKNTTKEYYGYSIQPNDYKKYQPYQPNS